MRFTSPTNEDIQINLDNGYSGTVFAGRYEELHPMFHRAALMEGAIVEHMEETTGSKAQLPVDMANRSELIINALREMIKEGDPEGFTNSGQPKIGKVREKVGFGIDREDMMAAWAIVSNEEN